MLSSAGSALGALRKLKPCASFRVSSWMRVRWSGTTSVSGARAARAGTLPGAAAAAAPPPRAGTLPGGAAAAAPPLAAAAAPSTPASSSARIAAIAAGLEVAR